MGLMDLFKASVEQGRINADEGNTPPWVGYIAIAMLGLVWGMVGALAYFQNLWAIPLCILAAVWSYSTWSQMRKNRS